MPTPVPEPDLAALLDAAPGDDLASIVGAALRPFRTAAQFTIHQPAPVGLSTIVMSLTSSLRFSRAFGDAVVGVDAPRSAEAQPRYRCCSRRVIGTH